MNTTEELIAARALIEKPENWTQGLFYYDRGNGVTAYCAAGAIAVAAGYNPATDILFDTVFSRPSMAVLGSVLPKVYHQRFSHDKLPYRVGNFNNESSHAEVLALFDRAIARSKLVDGMQAAPAREPEPV